MCRQLSTLVPSSPVVDLLGFIRLLIEVLTKKKQNDRKYLDNRSKCWARERDCPTVRIETRNKKGNSFLQKSSESSGGKKRP